MVPDIDRDMGEKAIKSSSPHSAAGPSALRPAFRPEALKTAVRDEVLEHPTSLVLLLARGNSPVSLAPPLAGANLYALPKTDGGV